MKLFNKSNQNEDMNLKKSKKVMPLKTLIKTFLFVLPYIFVEFTNTLLVTIDKSISNSIGKTAIIVFSSFITLNWAINTIQSCVGNAHAIVLVKDKNNSDKINNSAMLIEIISAIIISVLIFIFSEQITYVYNLENDARQILSTIIKLKAIQLPILSLSYIPKNILKIEAKTNKIWIATVVSSIINILGDYISVKLGYNEIGIYVATIVSSLVNTILLLLFSKYKLFKVTMKYIKEILYFAKDLVFDKIMQRIVNIYYTSVASSFETNIYAIHCVCGTIIDTLCEVIEGYYSGLLVDYSNDIDNKKQDLLKKVDSIGIYGILFSFLFIPIFIYPLWFFLGKSVSWNECNPYIWLYSIEFIATVAGCNYRAYLSANKNTKAIRMMAFIGGICVRVPLCYIIYKFNVGIIGLSFVCAIDRIVRAVYLRLYIKYKKKFLYT